VFDSEDVSFIRPLEWSPDGKELLYESRRTGQRDLWILPIDGGKARQLTHDVRDDYAGAWSSDGEWIAFLDHDDNVIPLDGPYWSTVLVSGGSSLEMNIIAEVADLSVPNTPYIGHVSPVFTVMGVPVGNYLAGNDFQKFDQAQRDFINAVLRRESGAVISDEEFANARLQYLPQPFEGPEILRQKAANRKIAIEGMRRSAGPLNQPAKPAGNSVVIDGNTIEELP
jgi:hypothetical protein